MNARFLAALAATLVAPVLGAQDDAHADDWFADFDKALAQAKAEDKALLVDFTGSDWCGWCIKLHDEVFAHDEFLTPAKKKFVLVALDFPKSAEIKAKVPNPERNQELAAEHAVQGYPTVLVMANDGTVLGRTGYQPGGPAAYMTHVDELLIEGKAAIAALVELEEAYAAATDKVPVIERAIAQLEELDAESPGVGKVAKIVRDALALDAEQFADLRKDALTALFRAGQADEKARKLATELDPKNDLGLLELAALADMQKVSDPETAKTAVVAVEALLDIEIMDEEVGVQLFSNAARFAMHPGVFGDAARAKPLARKALTFEIKNERLEAMLRQMAGPDDEPPEQEEVVEEVEKEVVEK